MFRVAYVTRSFLDYRVPVFESLNSLLRGQLYLIYSRDYVPRRVTEKVNKFLGDHAIGMTGEKRIGPNEFNNFANSAYRFVYQPNLIKQIYEIKPDVLIGDGFFQWTFYALLYKFWQNIPLVVCYERTFHTERNVQWFRTIYRRLALRYIDAMCCNGTLCSDYTQWLGMPNDRITTGHMVASVDTLSKQTTEVSETQKKSLRRDWGSPDLVFLSVGRLIRLKGYKELLYAWSLFQKQYAHRAKLVIIGSGPEQENLKNMVQKLLIKDVIFLGAVDYDDMAWYYASSDVFVMPTLEDNWSLVVPEAMACGLPVLCSKYNGCWPELVNDGANGWVFDPLNTEETLQALKNFVNAKDSGALCAMGICSRDLVSCFNPQTAAKSILDACQIAINYKQKKH